MHKAIHIRIITSKYQYLIKDISIVLILMLFALPSMAQQTYSDTAFTGRQTFADVLNNSDVVLRDVKHKPEYPGGKTAWQAYLHSSIDLTIPAKKRAPDGIYYVTILFIVGKNGMLRNIRAESGCGFGMEDEVIKCLKASPKWVPAHTSINEVVSFAARQMVIFKVKGTGVTINIP